MTTEKNRKNAGAIFDCSPETGKGGGEGGRGRLVRTSAASVPTGGNVWDFCGNRGVPGAVRYLECLERDSVMRSDAALQRSRRSIRLAARSTDLDSEQHGCR